VFKALVDLKKFNYEHIYSKANTKEQIDEYKKMFSKLFEIYLKQIEENKIDEDIYKLFLNDMVSEYLQNTNNSRKVIDYIAGMTDAYFIRQYEKYKNY
jgi:dGTPase